MYEGGFILPFDFPTKFHIDLRYYLQTRQKDSSTRIIDVMHKNLTLIENNYIGLIFKHNSQML